MAEAFRRLLGLVPVLLVGSIVLFFLLGKHPAVEQQRDLPLFFQPEPVSAASAAQAAMHGAAQGDAASALALAELGGAALPHVLPRLDELGVTERRRVAEALEPVARRMQIDSYRSGTSLDANSPAKSVVDERLLAWERYYEDHDLDFRPLSVERLVRRVSSRSSSLREADLLAVDTYALPYLVRALGRVDSADDVERIRRLTTVIARLRGQTYALPLDASPEQARALASRLRKDDDRHGAQFTDLTRLDSLTAHVTQTEFGVWWVQTVRELRGIDTPVVYATLARALSSSAWLLTVAFVGALVLGPVAAGSLLLGRLRAFDRTRSARTRQWLVLCCSGLLPLVCLLGAARGPLAPVILLFTAMLASTCLLYSELCDGLDWRSSAVLAGRSRAQRLRSIAASLIRTLPTLLPLIAGEVFLWVACLELSSKTDGLFPRTMQALERGDLHALLTLSLLSWTGIALVQTVSDALLSPGGMRRRSW